MRKFNKHTNAASMTAQPFGGLGFAMETVSLAAEAMTVTRLTGIVSMSMPSVVEVVAQPSGYSLLVALGREIRGR